MEFNIQMAESIEKAITRKKGAKACDEIEDLLKEGVHENDM
jgi:hypothetical protein